ncbi:ubiquitin-conjugating enzyme E2 G2 isoform X3 [Dromaius novaehollandiae]|uniref:ubiquitin-conjugating enzyme E2 G2 isoform X3 n=1 Tax=Dromaius novaehollandiae TaxID=8790 RepID=UPI00311DE672
MSFLAWRLCLWIGRWKGPEDTCFEYGVFPAILSFPLDYPLSPPKMRFTCEMFHPNMLPLHALSGLIIKAKEAFPVCEKTCTDADALLMLKFTQMGEFASLFSMLLATIPWDMRAALRGGVLCRALKRSCCQSLVCWQSQTMKVEPM